MDRNTSPIIGIDLGTSNSAVARFSEGSTHLIAAAQGERLTPSVIGIDDDGRLLVWRFHCFIYMN